MEDQQLRDLADNLVKQGITTSMLDAKRMASAMLSGTKAQTEKNSAAAQSSPVHNGLESVAPEQKYHQHTKSLEEQVMVLRGQVASLEQDKHNLQQELVLAREQLAATQQVEEQPQSVIVEPTAQTEQVVQESVPVAEQHIQTAVEQTEPVADQPEMPVFSMDATPQFEEPAPAKDPAQEAGIPTLAELFNNTGSKDTDLKF